MFNSNHGDTTIQVANISTTVDMVEETPCELVYNNDKKPDWTKIKRYTEQYQQQTHVRNAFQNLIQNNGHPRESQMFTIKLLESELFQPMILALVHYLNHFWGGFAGLERVAVQEIQKYNVNTGQWDLTANFIAMNELQKVYRNKHVKFVDKQNVVVWKYKIAELWADHDERKMYDNICFNPHPKNHPSVAQSNDYNLYKGMAISAEQAKAYQQTHGESYCKEVVKPLLEHIERVICKSNKENYQYLIKWMAKLVQKPWIKPKVAVGIQGEEGAGKGILYTEYLAKIVGPGHSFHVINPDDVVGRFNHMLRACILCFDDESLFVGNKAALEKLKKIITEPTISIEEKHKPTFIVDSFLHLLMASNNEHMLTQSANARRHFMLQALNMYSGQQTKESEEYFNKICNVPVEAFAYHLYHEIDIENWKPTRFPATDFQRDQKTRSFTPIHHWMQHCLSEKRITSYNGFNIFQQQPKNAQPETAQNIFAVDSVYPVKNNEGNDKFSLDRFATYWENQSIELYKSYVYTSYKTHYRQNKDAFQYKGNMMDETHFWIKFWEMVNIPQYATNTKVTVAKKRKHSTTDNSGSHSDPSQSQQQIEATSTSAPDADSRIEGHHWNIVNGRSFRFKCSDETRRQVAIIPSLQQCRYVWKKYVMKDQDWKFDEEMEMETETETVDEISNTNTNTNADADM
jgi:hypothetical protein